jgi:hypothetical protein
MATASEQRWVGSRAHDAPVGPREQIAARYKRFAEREAPGRSPLYEQVAASIAEEKTVLSFLAQMPPAKWQPNLLLAVVRYLYGTPSSADEFLEVIRANADQIAAVMAGRTTQTNEPARCATLLPVLARLPQPLALLEVGAAAGLCLLPDSYAFDYGQGRIEPSRPITPNPPLFTCRAGPEVPIPERNVEVAWRAGLDLHPIDLGDASEVRWLEALVWPGEEYRIPRLRAACEIARADPPRVIPGDLRTDLRELVKQAPADATLVVFHTAVLAYVRDAGARAAFARSAGQRGAVWIANEAPENIPGVAHEILRERPPEDDLLLCVDGVPTAWTDGHGTSIDWRTR